MQFDTKMKAYIEASKPGADEMFRIAKQHRVTYMTLNKAAMDIYRPILDAYVEQGLLDECIDYMYKNIPDTVERTLYIKMVLDKRNAKKEPAAPSC